MKYHGFTGLLVYILFFITPVYAQTTLTFSGSDSSMDRFVFSQILKGAYKNIGIDVFMEAMPSKRSLVSSNEGITDGEMARIDSIQNKYKNLKRVPVAIMTSGIYALSLQNNVIGNWQGLEGYSLAYRRGIQIIKSKLEQHNLSAQIMDRDDELMYFLLFGRTDLIIQDKGLAISSMKEVVKKGMRVHKVKFIEPPLMDVKLYHFLNKKYEHIVPRISHELNLLSKSGELDKKINQYYKTLME